jgi:hypothetical protein
MLPTISCVRCRRFYDVVSLAYEIVFHTYDILGHGQYVYDIQRTYVPKSIPYRRCRTYDSDMVGAYRIRYRRFVLFTYDIVTACFTMTSNPTISYTSLLVLQWYTDTKAIAVKKGKLSHCSEPWTKYVGIFRTVSHSCMLCQQRQHAQGKLIDVGWCAASH